MFNPGTDFRHISDLKDALGGAALMRWLLNEKQESLEAAMKSVPGEGSTRALHRAAAFSEVIELLRNDARQAAQRHDQQVRADRQVGASPWVVHPS